LQNNTITNCTVTIPEPSVPGLVLAAGMLWIRRRHA